MTTIPPRAVSACAGLAYGTTRICKYHTLDVGQEMFGPGSGLHIETAYRPRPSHAPAEEVAHWRLMDGETLLGTFPTETAADMALRLAMAV